MMHSLSAACTYRSFREITLYSHFIDRAPYERALIVEDSAFQLGEQAFQGGVEFISILRMVGSTMACRTKADYFSGVIRTIVCHSHDMMRFKIRRSIIFEERSRGFTSLAPAAGALKHVQLYRLGASAIHNGALLGRKRTLGAGHGHLAQL